jgi:hypothetical protein
VIPPGQGKARTQARNARRKKKRLAEKERSNVDLDPITSSSISSQHVQPFRITAGGHIQKAEDPTSQENDTLASSMVKATKNDNKKRGYKQGREISTHSRIVFDTIDPDISQRPTSSLSFRPPGRLIPPSQRMDLPGNMFVTSVDVEADEWDYQNSLETTQVTAPKLRQNNSVTKTSHDTEAFVATQREKVSEEYRDHVDWEEVERRWNDHKAVSSISSIAPGNVVLWKVRL